MPWSMAHLLRRKPSFEEYCDGIWIRRFIFRIAFTSLVIRFDRKNFASVAGEAFGQDVAKEMYILSIQYRILFYTLLIAHKFSPTSWRCRGEFLLFAISLRLSPLLYASIQVVLPRALLAPWGLGNCSTMLSETSQKHFWNYEFIGIKNLHSNALMEKIAIWFWKASPSDVTRP